MNHSDPQDHEGRIDALRQFLVDEGYNDVIDVGFSLDDPTLRRYLRARKWDVKLALQMIKSTIKWRMESNVNSLHQADEVIVIENSTGKMYCRGFDRHGHALIYMKPREENTNDHGGNIKHLIFTLEKTVACLLAKGDGVEKMSLVIDYTGYSLRNAPPMKTSKEVLHILQNHYPERLFKAYCLHPPWIMHAFWTVINPFIDPVTKEKIHMISGNADHVRQLLAIDIDVTVLEKSVGGDDHREFDSGRYVQGCFNKDYGAMLD